jgi:hypothetical protein
MLIMAQKFERWFKQCNESILNDARGGNFRQHFVRQHAVVRRVLVARKTAWNQAVKRGNEASR